MRLKELRERAGLTQEELGKKIGKTKTAISNIESGRNGARLSTLNLIAEALDVKVQDILSSTEHNTNSDISIQASDEQQVPPKIEGVDKPSSSTLCFVAISSEPENAAVYIEGIAPACEATGFQAFKADEYISEIEQAINDAIIAGIKRSYFCIADITTQNANVYLEAGYALGRGLKVVFTCQNDALNNLSSIVRNHQYVIYNTPDELRKKLINKIEAWIKE